MDIPGFINEVQKIYNTGAATEHSYRAALQYLLSSIGDGIVALNEPKRVSCGAPDFLVNRGEIVIGHVEAKDIDKNLSSLKGAELAQKARYLQALPNLVYTNCLAFEFYRQGELLSRINIAEFDNGIRAIPEHYAALEHQLENFAAQRPQSIASSEKLAQIMAGKAILIKDVLFQALRADEELQTELAGQYRAFQEHLIHDITREDFADIYAETIAYGMFAARLHDDSLDDFSRQEALELLPKSNPFLRALFSYIAGPDLDDRIKWIIDDLADVFQATDVRKIMENFGSLTGRNDPFLHFYETFLAKYNPAKRKSRGVWYTPESVVSFIVRAVDDVLKDEFGLSMGLGDTSKVTIEWDTGQKALTKRGKITKSGKNATQRKDVHRVQILDPATGTGTFLAEVIKQVAPKVKGVAEGMWSGYIEKDLIPRIHGFELLMASYAMCHMKLDMVLSELGYRPSGKPPRLGVYLTNSLEEGEPANQTLPFAQWLSNEVKQANAVKRDMPIMCVIGNPPYSIQSANLGKDQVALIDPYRSVDGVRIKEKGMLQFEKNINNDYIKFIALAEQIISRRKYGILSYITSHGYLKSSSFRGLRHHLMKTFDEIRIIDLHGNSEVREVPPEGITDKNVFDIKQGVAIIVAWLREEKTDGALASVQYADMWGARQEKYDALAKSHLHEIEWHDCAPTSPNYTFHPSGATVGAYQSEYFGIAEVFPVYSSGVITARDSFVISEQVQDLIENAEAFAGNEHLSDTDLCEKLKISLKKGWDVNRARKRLRSISNYRDIIHPISYRPFDNRNVLFDESVVWTTARATMDHMLRGENIALITARSEKSGTCSHFFVSKHLVETKCGERTTQSAVFPLFLYPSEGDLEKDKRINFDMGFWKKIKAKVSSDERGEPTPIAVFDYIYGVLHCPAYRDTFAEFLKIDFPRVPWPSSTDEFWDVAEKGQQLRHLHLMEEEAVGAVAHPFRGDGDGLVVKPTFSNGEVWINDTQRFCDVSEVAWNFFIGGYQPAQKWLKDRKGCKLSFEDIVHYQKIIKVLNETDRIMKTISIPSISSPV